MITYLEAIRLAQQKALATDPRVFLYGQDIGTFGGAFKATKNLAAEFPGRVIDAPLSEDAIVGMAIGAAIEGARPIVEMQFADFSTCGLNQIVNHAGTLFYRTGVPCPIVVRLPSGGTSGGGPFHSQSLEAIYAHWPGLVVVTPATVEDAYTMLLEAVALDDPVVFASTSFSTTTSKPKPSPRPRCPSARPASPAPGATPPSSPMAPCSMNPSPLRPNSPRTATNSKSSISAASNLLIPTPCSPLSRAPGACSW